MSRKVRQHVNPYSFLHLDTGMKTLRLPADKKVEVDLGCAAGHYLFRRAQKEKDAYLVGLEIRRALVDLINEEAKEKGIDHRIKAFCTNLIVDFGKIFPENRIDLITMQFPDPWFKKKHKKRRALTPEMAHTITEALKVGGCFFFQTDVFDLALDALYVLDTVETARISLENKNGPWRFAQKNPLSVLTQREIACKKKNRKVWRLLYRKRPITDLSP